ncbi:unnamed protein product, partial [Polarella glacialis]
MPEDAQERLQANLQGQLRKLICQGLTCLDLSDAGTVSQLEPALSFMKLLIERFKVRGQLEEALSAKQWMLLQGILADGATTLVEANLESSLTEGSVRRKGGLRTTKGGVYTPNPKIQVNPLVRNTGTHVILTCSKCGLELKSSWVFEHRGKVATLVPTDGHSACRAKYVHTDAKISVKRDIATNLNMCIHGGLATQCVKCGGSQTC